MSSKPIQAKSEETPVTTIPEDLRVAYEVHTLAQLLYGELAATHPWLVQPPVPTPMAAPQDPYAVWPTPAVGTWPAAWPAVWGHPLQGWTR